MARVLVKKNIAKAIRRAQQKRDGQDPPDDHLSEGFMVSLELCIEKNTFSLYQRLYSFYTPALGLWYSLLRTRSKLTISQRLDRTPSRRSK